MQQSLTKPFPNGALLYELIVPPKLNRLLAKMRNKDIETYKELKGKLDRILNDPYRNAHPLRGKYKNIWETHIKNKLLLYSINDIHHAVELVDIIDHDELR